MDYLKKLLKNKKSLNNAVMLLLMGVFLVALSNSFFKGSNDNKASPEKKVQEEIAVQEEAICLSYEKELAQEIEETLSMVQGVGKIKVMINTEEGYENIIKNDYKKEKYEENGSSRAIDEEKTVFNDSGEPIVLKEVKPKIEGIIIVAEGGDNVLVKNSLINAVQALLGVEAHKIEILKMK